MIYLTLDDALTVVERVGFVVRDRDLLEGCLGRPMATAFGEDAYPGIADKAAALLEAINRSHPLIDGNKRLSWICMLLFLRSNGSDLVSAVDDSESFVLAVANGDLTLDEIADWISGHIFELG